MAVDGKKLTVLLGTSNIASTAILYVVEDPAGTPVANSITVANLFGKINANVVLSNNSVLEVPTLISTDKRTPANSGITIARGTMFYDDSYLYIATSNNTIKRLPLNSF